MVRDFHLIEEFNVLLDLHVLQHHLKRRVPACHIEAFGSKRRFMAQQIGRLCTLLTKFWCSWISSFNAKAKQCEWQLTKARPRRHPKRRAKARFVLLLSPTKATTTDLVFPNTNKTNLMKSYSWLTSWDDSVPMGDKPRSAFWLPHSTVDGNVAITPT